MTKLRELKCLIQSLRQIREEELIKGFIREAKATNPTSPDVTYDARQRHVRFCTAYSNELARRDQLDLLLPLLASPDSWIAFCTAERLGQYKGMESVALATLDSVANDISAGVVARLATICRDAIRRSERNVLF